MVSFRLDGKVALVTGASSGLGRHCAEVLHGAGAVVGLAARRKERLDDLAAELGEGAYALPMDVTDSTSIKAGFDRLEDIAGEYVTVIVNNAGIVDGAGFIDAKRTDTGRIFATNQMAVFEVAQQAARRMIEAKCGGSIINIASIAGLRVIGGAASYAISKAAVVHMTRVQAFESARYGIRVNALAPGYIETDMNADFLASPAGQKMVNRIPMQRAGKPQDLDGALLLLASDAGGFITGAILPVDGGHLVATL